MALAMIPKIVYNAITLTLTIPSSLSTPSSEAEGGSARATSGVGESFKVARFHMAGVVIRFLETEWPGVDAWLTYAQDNYGATFEYWFDQNLIATKYIVYLESPRLGQERGIEPERDIYLPAYRIPIKLRNSVASRFAVTVF